MKVKLSLNSERRLGVADCSYINTSLLFDWIYIVPKEQWRHFTKFSVTKYYNKLKLFIIVLYGVL